MNQYTITATQTFTFYKTVHAESLADAHVQAHDPQDDWTCYWDRDYDDPTPENGEFVVTHIEDEGEI